MTTGSGHEKKVQLSGKYEVAQYILGMDFRKKIGDNEELKALLQEELRILEGFYGLAFDTGLARIRSYGKENASPIYLLRRTIGFGKLFSDEEDLESGTLEILFIEVNEIGKMDRAVDEQGNHAADYVLNNVAAQIQIAIAEAQASFWEDTEGEDIACRYTGDEFVVILRNRSETYKEKLSQKIETKLQTLQGFFAEENGQIKLKNIEISIHAIKTPSEAEKKEIYLAFLKRTIILNENQIKKIQERMQIHDLDFAERSIYPESVKTIEQKTQFILSTHPELEIALKIARILDGRETKERTELTLSFIENIFFNKTLGNDVYSFVNLQWRIAQGELSHLWVAEFKFLKEINESLSLVDGDEVLQKVYETIKSLFTEEDRKKAILFQRGGVFAIGIIKGTTLSEETERKLLYLSSVNIYEETDLQVPLGRSKVELMPKGEIETEEDMIKRTNNDLSNALSLAETNWYHRMIDVIDDSRDEYISILEAEKWRVEEEMNEVHVMTLSYLVWHFFHGKEGYYRSKKALEVSQGRKELTQTFEKILET